MCAFFTKVIAFFTSLFTLIGAVLFPAEKIEGVFPDVTVPQKAVFDEGEFQMKSYDLVVAPNGDDNNSGTLDAPLKTPEAAKEKLKKLKDADCGTVTVWFREGDYRLDSELKFNADDCGNVIYRSYPNEKVVFSGGREISEWGETEINGVKAFVSDIELNSEDDYFYTLFKGEKRLSRPVWPKEGAFEIAQIEDADIVSGAGTFVGYAAMYLNDGEIMDFTNPQDVLIKVMHYWFDEKLPIANVNVENNRIELARATSMTLRVGDNYVYENVREMLTEPGEWYLDRAQEKLYYIPEEGDTVENTVLFAGEAEKLVDINGINNIKFQGIDFLRTDWCYAESDTFLAEKYPDNPLWENIKYESAFPQAAYDQPAAVSVANASNIDFVNCVFAGLSNAGLMFGKNTTYCTARSCNFEDIGANAVFIKGERVIPATTNNITLTDCHISHYGRVFNNAVGVMLVDAADCELSYNEVHDGWYTGISVGWVWGYSDNPTNGIKVKNNLIYNIGNGWLSDMGGIYTLGIQPDTVISGNVIYNVGCYGGNNGYGGWGIYLDEGSSYILVEKNLVYDCSSHCFHQHYGEDNMIRNNIFAFGGEGALKISKKEDHNSLYLYNNIFVADDTVMYTLEPTENWFIDDGNVYWDYDNKANVYSGKSMQAGERFGSPIWAGRGYYNNAVFADPVFKSAADRDFTLALNSPALQTSFEAWEYDAGTRTKF